MASGDATLVCKKNTAYRHTFVIQKADGTAITGATGLDSEVSKDGGAFADCTNEATEIAQGFYYLDLTSTEMNADTVALIVKTTSTGAVPYRVVFVTADRAFEDLAFPITSGRGLLVDTSGYTTMAATAAGAITATSIATDAIDADALATDAVNEIADGVLDRSVAEPSAAFSWPVSLRKFIQFVQALHNNKVTQTSTTTSLRNAADSGNIATFATSDDGTTFTRGKAT